MARRRRGRRRAPLTARQRFWMTVWGWALVAVGVVTTLFFCVTLWNNLYILLLTILILFLLAGLPIIMAYRTRRRLGLKPHGRPQGSG
jgi:hypothetical protein